MQIFVTVTLVTAVTACVSGQHVTMDTRLGKVTGMKEQSLENKTIVYKFYNIPFAKPPVGRLRFAKPEPFGNWNGTLNATVMGGACMQGWNPYTIHNYTGVSEDCLQLNIYVPNNISSTAKRSVMVWVHGGAYQVGSATTYNATMLAAHGDVVVVTINYRLGIFGFLSFNDTLARGNFGLWDQILALKWVNENIADYTGNPDSVTIFGQSAGGFSVSLLSLIPQNKGLFHRVIAQSGVSDTFFAITNDTKLVSAVISDASGCPYDPVTKDYKKVLSCLRSKSAIDIQKTLNFVEGKVTSTIRIDIPLAPVIDGELFNEYPSKLLANNQSREFVFFQSLDMIVGNVNMEGSLFLLTSPREQKRYNFNLTTGIPTQFLCKDLTPALADEYFNRNRKVSDAMCAEYTVNNDLDEQSRQVVQMYTDMLFIAPSFATLNARSKTNSVSKTYQYIFTQTSPLPLGAPRPSWFRGVGHADEIVFLFGMENLHFMNISYTADQYDLSLKMKEFWTNFAKKG